MNLGSIKDKTNKKQTVRKICAAAAVGCVAIVAVATAIKLGGNNNNVAPVIEKPKTTQSTESGNDVSLTTPAPRTTPAPAPTDKAAGAETADSAENCHKLFPEFSRVTKIILLFCCFSALS